MIDEQTQLNVQAWLDGELAPAERKAIERLVSTNPQTRALVEELRAAKAAFSGVSAQLQVPVSRELYWSAIENGIRREERRGSAAESNGVTSWFELFRRYLVPAGTLAALVIAGLLAFQSGGLEQQEAARVESALASAGSLTYRDFASGTTLVWVSYPAETEIAEYGGSPTLP